MRTRQILFIFLILVGFPFSGKASERLIGQASVTDGDTIKIQGLRIRLYGIDAPESRQLCTRPDDKKWPCGKRATFALQDFIDGRSVTCDQRARDKYKRIVAVCHIGDVDINAWLVSNGWALAYRQYSRDYVADEAEAEEEKRGVWGGGFMKPWDWRREHRRH